MPGSKTYCTELKAPLTEPSSAAQVVCEAFCLLPRASLQVSFTLSGLSGGAEVPRFFFWGSLAAPRDGHATDPPTGGVLLASD